MTPRELFLSRLTLIDTITREVAWSNRVPRDEEGDFNAYVRLRLVADNYAAVAAYRGDSPLRTYLTTVILRLFVDYAKTYWGRFRPSAEARNAGEAAVRLERLMVRDELDFDAAFDALVAETGGALDREGLLRLSQTFPPRVREAGSGAARAALADPAAAPEAQQLALAHEATLRAIFLRLSAEDRLLLRLRYEESLAVREIAATLGHEPRALFHRFDRLLRELHRAARVERVAWNDVRLLLEQGCDLGRLLAEPRRGDPDDRESSRLA